MKLFKIHCVIFALLLSFAAKAQTTNYQVYSLYVLNIAKYSSWPEVEGEFNITVFGKSKSMMSFQSSPEKT